MKLLIEFIFASCLIAGISAAAMPGRIFERDVGSDCQFILKFSIKNTCKYFI